MKKNLLSILILVLLLVNIALTAVMMINVTGTNQKTADLVTSIATVMNLELYEPGGGLTGDVALSDTETYDMEDFTVALALSEGDSTQHYIVFDLSLLQNTKDEDYETLGGSENLSAREKIIRSEVESVIGNYTIEDCQSDLSGISDEILEAIQNLYGSAFIYKIAFSSVAYG